MMYLAFSVAVNLDDPSTDYTSCYIDIKSADDTNVKSHKETSNGDCKEKVIHSLFIAVRPGDLQ